MKYKARKQKLVALMLLVITVVALLGDTGSVLAAAEDEKDRTTQMTVPVETENTELEGTETKEEKIEETEIDQIALTEKNQEDNTNMQENYTENEKLISVVTSERNVGLTNEKLIFHVSAENKSYEEAELQVFFCKGFIDKLELGENIKESLPEPATEIWMEGLDEKRKFPIKIQVKGQELKTYFQVKEEIENDRVTMKYASLEMPVDSMIDFDIHIWSEASENISLIPILIQDEEIICGTPASIYLEYGTPTSNTLWYKDIKSGIRRLSVVEPRAVVPYDTSDEIEINLHDYDDTCLNPYYANPIPNMHKQVIEQEAINKGRPFTFQYFMCDYFAGYRRWQNNYYMTPEPEPPKKYQKGIVAPLLSNGYPVLSKDTTAPGFSLDYLFNGKTSPGVIRNYSNLTDLFTKSVDGTYQLSHTNAWVQLDPDTGRFVHTPVDYYSSFLPMTNLSGQQYNYWFGMDLSLRFQVPENHQINGEDMIYTFEGDDDLWVYIDDVLVLDIGGIHSGLNGSINFTTGKVTEGWVYTTRFAEADVDPAYKVIGKQEHTIADSFQKAGREWNDEVGTKHVMKIFYLERGNGGSRCAMTFKLPVVSKKNGYIKVKKNSSNSDVTDGNANYSLANAEYTIYKDAACTTKAEYGGVLRTDANGNTAEIEILPGTYYVKETKASAGFHLDQTIHKIIVSEASATAVVNSTEPLKTGTLKLTKKSKNPDITEGNACYSLKDAEYSVYKDKNCTDYLAKIVTDAQGNAIWENIPFGTFYIKESKASAGFELDQKIYEVNITDTTPELLAKVVSNEIPGNTEAKIEITKKGEGEDNLILTTLEGTQFTIRYYDGFYTKANLPDEAKKTWVIEVQKNESAGAYQTYLSEEYRIKELSDEFYHDVNGNVILPYGTISIQETKAASGYSLEGEMFDENGIKIGQSQDVYVSQVTKENDIVRLKGGNVFTVKDKAKRGSIKLRKFDFNGKTPLQGVMFEIADSTGNVIASKTTDANGEILFDELYPDQYIITETSTTEGHTLLKDPLVVEIPKRVTEQEIVDYNIDKNQCIYDEAENSYFIYNFTYNISNHANFAVPMTGGNIDMWTFLPLGAGFALLVVMSVFILKKKRAPEGAASIHFVQ